MIEREEVAASPMVCGVGLRCVVRPSGAGSCVLVFFVSVIIWLEAATMDCDHDQTSNAVDVAATNIMREIGFLRAV